MIPAPYSKYYLGITEILTEVKRRLYAPLLPSVVSVFRPLYTLKRTKLIGISQAKKRWLYAGTQKPNGVFGVLQCDPVER